MVTCQSSELGWEVTVELPAYFLSPGRGYVIGFFSCAAPLLCSSPMLKTTAFPFLPIFNEDEWHLYDGSTIVPL